MRCEPRGSPLPGGKPRFVPDMRAGPLDPAERDPRAGSPGSHILATHGPNLQYHTPERMLATVSDRIWV